jgi:2-phosphoglycerate kinase
MPVDLTHLFWLGGSPCAGKSSISEILARRFGLRVYHVDQAFEAHAPYLSPERQLALRRWLAASCQERWMLPVEALVQQAIDCYSEVFELVLGDLLALPDDQPLLVEGTALLPGLVAKWLTERRRALWLVAEEKFQRQHYARRGWVGEILQGCPDPAAAFENWMRRDAAFAEWITKETTTASLDVLRIDSNRTIEEIADLAARHFHLDSA